MPQETRVLEPGRDAAARLRAALESEGYLSRSVPHAVYSLFKPGCTVTYYLSGKLVLQGAGLDSLLERHLPECRGGASAADDERVGTDEAGKGDYFGPLVVAAAFAAEGEIARLRRIGVADSKRLSDDAVARIGAALEASMPHAVVVLDPTDYNRRYEKVRNVNKLLGELHGEAILELSKRVACRRVLTDQFGDIEHVRRGLGSRSAEFALEARPRAEEHVAVAAASILARRAFLDGLRRLSDECGVDLPKGAGDPVERIAPRVLAVLGPVRLGSVAKLHFKTTDRLFARGGGRP